jgi:MoaA/NifB/PqqE/SkfB family radical SAM enzyme
MAYTTAFQSMQTPIIEPEADSMMADQLTKLYVELTTNCNLDCQMCVRHTWQESHGDMPMTSFRQLVDQMGDYYETPVIHFGGYGEPMQHPQFLECVQLAKQAGARVEVTSNGTLLNHTISSALIDLELDRLVISIDSAIPTQYNDIRVGASFEQVFENLRDLYRLRLRRIGRRGGMQVELAFVIMKQNVDSLPLLPRLATAVGAHRVIVSNVIPHTPSLERQILYEKALRAPAYRASYQVPDVSLPRLDLSDNVVESYSAVFGKRASISLLNQPLSERSGYCQFAQEGYTAVRWDGAVSPCLSLLHDHPEYLHGRRRQITGVTLGNINQQPLREIWQSPQFANLRRRLRSFEFSPCTTCGGCERFPENLTDCTENPAPTCGGCLWAQGLIQCP